MIKYFLLPNSFTYPLLYFSYELRIPERKIIKAKMLI